MNRCPETIKVQDWLDGELAPAEAARFEAHLTACGECEAEALTFRVVFNELRAVPFTPLEIPLGQACEFNVYHLMTVDSPTALFPIKYEEIA